MTTYIPQSNAFCMKSATNFDLRTNVALVSFNKVFSLHVTFGATCKDDHTFPVTILVDVILFDNMLHTFTKEDAIRILVEEHLHTRNGFIWAEYIKNIRVLRELEI